MKVSLPSRLHEWWSSRPIGYSELHAPLALTRSEFRAWVRNNWAYRLPQDTRARNIRIQFLTEDHCMYKRAINHMDHRPHVEKFRCRRHGV